MSAEIKRATKKDEVEPAEELKELPGLEQYTNRAVQKMFVLNRQMDYKI